MELTLSEWQALVIWLVIEAAEQGGLSFLEHRTSRRAGILLTRQFDHRPAVFSALEISLLVEPNLSTDI